MRHKVRAKALPDGERLLVQLLDQEEPWWCTVEQLTIQVFLDDDGFGAYLFHDEELYVIEPECGSWEELSKFFA